jgi:DNA-binding MarR family transcriptional regulator
MADGSDIAIALRAAYLALHRRLEERFASHGVTADQFVRLATLALGGAITQRELARRMSSDPSFVLAMLVLLAQRRLIKRETHPTDARAQPVALTKEVMRMFRKLRAAGESVRARMLASLWPDEVETMIGFLARVAAGLNAKGRLAGESTSIHSQEDET